MERKKEPCPMADKSCVHRNADNACTLLFDIDFNNKNHPCPFQMDAQEWKARRLRTLKLLVAAGRDDLIRKYAKPLLGISPDPDDVRGGDSNG